jgi:catechol 2,3-dioxygenase-like lactoylglutathione lyase family enzyme
MRPPITGIAHVTLYADEMAKSQQFYQSLLGWEMVPGDHARSGVRFYANHLQYIELISPPDSGRMDRLESIAFVTTDTESLRRYLDSRQVVVPQSLTIDRDGAKTLLVYDPEGNRIAFVQPGTHPLPEPRLASRRLSSHIIHAGYTRWLSAPDGRRLAGLCFLRSMRGFRQTFMSGTNSDAQSGCN